MEKLKAVIFDVDGTLFDYKEKKIHKSTMQAIEQLQSKKIAVIIASGRSYSLLGEELLKNIKADYFVTANGHCVLDCAGRELFSKRFTFEQTEYVVSLAKTYGDGLMLKYNNTSCIYSRPEEMFQIFNNIGLDKKLFTYCTSMDYHSSELPMGFTIRGGRELKQALQDHPKEYRVELFHDITECDIFNPNINKMTALHQLTTEIGLLPENCIAYGDSRNDIEMIKWAGCGIAMGNSCQELKMVADKICGTSWQDGISTSLKLIFSSYGQPF